MKRILLSIGKFVLLFVPAYLAIGWFSPNLGAKLLAEGFLPAVATAVRRGLILGTLFVGGLWLADKCKKT